MEIKMTDLEKQFKDTVINLYTYLYNSEINSYDELSTENLVQQITTTLDLVLMISESSIKEVLFELVMLILFIERIDDKRILLSQILQIKQRIVEMGRLKIDKISMFKNKAINIYHFNRIVDKPYTIVLNEDEIISDEFFNQLNEN